MPFAESQRHIYEHNVLEQVFCQFRYPTILRIDSEVPARFQDAIRGEYPLLRRAAPELPPEVVQAVQQLNANIEVGPPGYNFLTEDGKWTLTITRDFLTLSTSAYQRWETFKEHLARPLQAFIEIYSPAFYSRLGLRYRDVIKRSALSLDVNTPWAELLKPSLIGILGSAEMAADIERYGQDVLMRLPDLHGQVHIQHGLGKTRDASREECYLIDSDFFTTKRTTINDAIQTIDYFNEHARRLFHWCISDRLHQAMGPRPIE